MKSPHEEWEIVQYPPNLPFTNMWDICQRTIKDQLWIVAWGLAWRPLSDTPPLIKNTARDIVWFTTRDIVSKFNEEVRNESRQ